MLNILLPRCLFHFGFISALLISPLAAQTTFSGGHSVSDPGSNNTGNHVALQPYPSTVNVSGFTAGQTVTKITVQVNGFSTNTDGYFNLALKSPTGAAMVVWGGVGSGNAVSNLTLVFDDSGSTLPINNNTGVTADPVSGTHYKPEETVNFNDHGSNNFDFFTPDTANFPNGVTHPQPNGIATLASTFNGSAPNGTWSLYGDDPFGNDADSFSSWSITITAGALSTTTTTLVSSSPSDHSFVGDSVTFTAQVNNGAITDGTVTFTEGTTVLQSGSGYTYTTNALSEGTHTIVASFNGDSTHSGSNANVIQTVDRHSVISNLSATGGTFCDPSAITIPAGQNYRTPFLPYPSKIFVGHTADPSGPGQPADFAGTISKITVDLKNFSMTTVDGASMLLVGPNGKAYDFFSSIGNGASANNASNLNITLDDAAGSQLPTTAPTSGTFRPTAYVNTALGGQQDSFPAPAPQTGIAYAAPEGGGSAATFGSQFSGSNANGTWQLFVYDQAGGPGTLAGGWCIDVTVGNNLVTTTTVTSSSAASQSFRGSSVTFTATVKQAGNPVTTGTVTFFENGVQLQSGQVPNGSGQVTYSTSSLGDGRNTITASYSGATGLAQSSGSVTQSVDEHTSVTGNTYCYPAQVTIPLASTLTSPTPYPVRIFVGNNVDSGSPNLAGTINTLNVSLNSFSSAFPRDIQSLLVGPNASQGATLSDSLDFFSHVGNGSSASGVNVTLSDSAAATFNSNNTLASGIYKPTSTSSPDTYGSPAPAGPFNYAGPIGSATLNGVFANQLPDGIYNIYFKTADASATIAGSSNNSVCLSFTLNSPVLAISKTAGGRLVQGGNAGTYTITVTNNGPGSTAGTVTVTDSLPGGLTASSISAPNWSCSGTTSISCTRSDVLTQGSSYDVINLNIATAANATPGNVNNTASVSGGGTSATVNNTVSATIYAAPVLTIGKTHTNPVTQGGTAVYTITVNNTAASSTTAGTTTVTDTLPTGWTLNTFSGTGWSCSSSTNVVTCSSTQAVNGGSSYNALVITANVPANSAVSVTNTASVSGGGAPVSPAAANDPTTVVQAPASITLTGGNNQSVTVGTAFTSLQATVKDAGGLPVAGASVVFTSPTLAGNPSGTFSNGTNTTTTTTDSSGVASASFTANLKAGTYSVSAATGALAPVNFTETNVAGAAASVVVSSGSGQSTAIGTAYAPLVAMVTDANGNNVSGASVTFATVAGGSGATGTFASSAAVITGSNGRATASTLTANNTAGAFTATATVAGLTSATFNLTNTAGTASSISVSSGSGQSAAVTTAFGSPLVALVRDSGSNPVSGVTVTFTAPASGASGTFPGSVLTATAITGSNGLATSPTFTANGTAGPYNVSASAAGVGTAASFSLTNTAGAPGSVSASSGSGQSAAISTSFASPLVAFVRDSGSNPVSGVTVTFTAPGSGASGTFPGSVLTATAITGSNGLATSPTFTANGTAGSYNVSASATGVATATNFALTNTAGTAASISVSSGSGQSTATNTAFGSNLVALVKDSGGNAVSGVTVTFTAPASGASGTFPGSALSATAQTGANGLATAPMFTANGTAGGYNVTAGTAGVAASASFALTNTAANITVTVSTNINAPVISVDGGASFTGSQNFTWALNSTHTLAATTPQTFGNTQYNFAAWSDGGALSHTVTAAAGTTAYTANFSTAYQLTVLTSPSAGGTVNQSSGQFFTSGTVVPLTATANAGYTFTSWTGNVANAASASTSITITSPQTVTANFAAGQTGILAQLTGKSGPANGRVWNFGFTNNGPGAAAGVTINGFTLTQQGGAACTPNVSTPLPSLVGDAAPSTTIAGSVTIDFSGCAANSRFKLTMPFSANGGAVSGTLTVNNQFQ